MSGRSEPDGWECIDTHAHLDSRRFQGEVHSVVDRARERGVTRIVTIGTDVSSSEQAVHLASRFSGVYASVGVHPHDARTVTGRSIEQLRSLAGEPRVVAIGEVGLDYYRDLSPRPVQRDVFRAQLQLAVSLALPVVVHDRDAHEDIMTILDDEVPSGNTVIMHCFSGDREMADECIRRRYYLSVAGPVTYPKADDRRAITAGIPLDLLVVETDCPYLSPHPFRSKRNEPAYVVEVVSAVAGIRGLPLDHVARHTTANARRAFGLE